jgi:phosphatidylethanolamine/phosphatidyl-N-methylethanolamine N-methyltransferase
MILKKAATERVRSRYDRISPYYDFMESILERIAFARWRKRVFDSLHGEKILEVGVGTGKNFDFYPGGKKITAIDFSPKMLSKARNKAKAKGLSVDLVEMDVQDLRFADQTFDTIIATFVFCSVPDPIKGLREIKRVCKKDGKIILLEHVRPGGAFGGKIFDFFNPLTVKLMGVNINRDTVANMQGAGLKIIKEKNLFLDIVKLICSSP